MSAIWQIVIGGAAAIAGGFGAAWWQTSRADKIAQKIRRAERREEGLLALNIKVTEVHDELQSAYRVAERGPGYEYERVDKSLTEFKQFWQGSSSGVILDESIRAAYHALDIAGSSYRPDNLSGPEFVRRLSADDRVPGQRSLADLGNVVAAALALKKAVERQLDGLLRQP